jgi:hypothetical protein
LFIVIIHFPDSLEEREWHLSCADETLEGVAKNTNFGADFAVVCWHSKIAAANSSGFRVLTCRIRGTEEVEWNGRIFQLARRGSL